MLALLDRAAGERAREDVDRALIRQVDLQALRLENYFERARASILLTARNRAFAAFYSRPGTRGEKIRRGVPELAEANSALGFLERLYPSSIGEACFIDAGGAENARVVRGLVASEKELSPDERGASFFRPTMALEPGQVYQAKPYVSEDTGEWVVSNSTPLRLPGRGTVAIVHFEVTIESFRQEAARRTANLDIDVVDAADGRVIFSSETPQRVGAPLGPVGHESLASITTAGQESGLANVEGGRAAFRRIHRSVGNANDWYVVAVDQRRAGSLVAGLGAVPLALLALSMGLAAIFASRRWSKVHHDLESVSASRDELHRAARVDSLTGIGNHRAFHERLAWEVADRADDPRPLTLAMLDLDDLKITNDRLGHGAGDERLIELAGTLAEAAPGAIAFRVGGDEFALLLVDGRALEAVALVGAIRAPRADGSGRYGIDVTAGVAEHEPGLEATELVRRADQALVEAKRAHRGVVTFTPGLLEEMSSADRPSPDSVTLATALARAVDAKDSYTRSHCETVAEACVLIGRELGLPPARLERLRLAGLLHDVGKIGTPDRILQKPGALTQEEFEVMKRHVTLGARILLGADLPDEAGWILHHHERVDGRGYPDGLAGDAIPLESRIILVADAFEAMTSDRPYRKGRPVADALAELRACSGTQFCGECVEAFCRAMEGRVDEVVPASLRLEAEMAAGRS